MYFSEPQEPDVLGRPLQLIAFPVQDLMDGTIYYHQSMHEGAEPVQDSFLFTVTDGINKSPEEMVNITIMVR